MTAVGAVTLTVALALPASASTATSKVNSASPQLASPELGGLFYIINNTGWAITGTTSGGAFLGNGNVYQTTDQMTYKNQVYYQYEDTTTHLCLQANSSDQNMVEGRCDPTSHRQYWHWNGGTGYLINLTFQSHAFAETDDYGSLIGLDFGSGDRYIWGIHHPLAS